MLFSQGPFKFDPVVIFLSIITFISYWTKLKLTNAQ